MTTPEFEEWLMRQDIPVEAQTEIDKFIQFLKDEHDISGGTVDVAKGKFKEMFKYDEQLGIVPFEVSRETPEGFYKETRYQIEGIKGAWGYENYLVFAEQLAEAYGQFGIAEYYRQKQRDAGLR